MKTIILTFTLALLISVTTKATTWMPIERTCPICKHANRFYSIASYGSYIYHWSSKYQYVFWPYIDSNYLYCCPHCYFTTFGNDFTSVPKSKVLAIKIRLKLMFIDKREKIYPYVFMLHNKREIDYRKISKLERMEIAEKMYKILKREPEFWCHFYRVMGFCYDNEGKTELARVVRLKALHLAKTKLLTEASRADKEKETLIILSSMCNFTDQQDSALHYLEKAKNCTYSFREYEDDNPEGMDEYLNDLIMLYQSFILEDEKNTIKY